MMKEYSFLCLLVLLSVSSFAQDKLTDKISVNITLTGTGTEGNLDRWIFLNRIETSYRFNPWLTNDQITYFVYGTIRNNEFENNLLNASFYNFEITDKFIPFAAIFFERYAVRDQERRRQFGAGLKYKFLSKGPALLATSLMFSYNDQSFDRSNFRNLNNGNSRDIENGYVTPIINLNIPLFKNQLLLSNTFWYQIDTSSNENHRSFYDGKAMIKLTDKVGFSILVSNYWENITLTGIQTQDFLLAYGITANLF